MYVGGVGVPKDYVVVYAWLNLAAAQGNELIRDQIARAQELSSTLLDRIN